jgi:hypothetical protein
MDEMTDAASAVKALEGAALRRANAARGWLKPPTMPDVAQVEARLSALMEGVA